MRNIDLKQNYYKIKPEDNFPVIFGMFYSNEPNTGNLMFIYNISSDLPRQLTKETIIINHNSTKY